MGLIMLQSTAIRGQDLAALFRPSFLRMFESRRHRGHLRRAKLAEYAAGFASLAEFLEAVYARMKAEYRCEYVFKNELLDAGPATALIAPHFAVYSELPVAHFTGRVDMLVCERTTTSYEVKSDIDGLARLESQIAMNQQLFDYNYVVCSTGTLGAVRGIVRGTRAGIVIFDQSGFAIERKAKSNAPYVDPDAIFGTIRHAERVAVLRRHHIEPVDVLPAYRYDAAREAFALLTPRQAHEGLVLALRARTRGKVAQTGQFFEGLPRSLKHLFFQSKEAERSRLLSRQVLARAIR